MTLFCDNKAAIMLLEDPTTHTWVKHFNIKYHFICEHAQMENIIIKYVNIRANVVDMFTKALPKPLFVQLYQMLRLS